MEFCPFLLPLRSPMITNMYMTLLLLPWHFDPSVYVICGKLQHGTVSVACDKTLFVYIGGSKGAPPACAPPPSNGTKFFRFHIHFHQKVPTSEVTPPPTGNPGSATGVSEILIKLSIDNVLKINILHKRGSISDIYVV